MSGTEVAGQRKRIRDAALHGAPESAKGWPVQVLLVDVRPKLGTHSLDQVGAAGDDRAGLKAQRHQGNRESVPGW